jgi:tRNA U34 2-thiouridine synthase MnmA/TrmU
MKMVLGAKGLLPTGLPCIECNKTIKPGQWAAVKKVGGQWIAIHRGHLLDLYNQVDEDALDKSVEDAYNELKEMALTNGESWT